MYPEVSSQCSTSQVNGMVDLIWTIPKNWVIETFSISLKEWRHIQCILKEAKSVQQRHKGIIFSPL